LREMVVVKGMKKFWKETKGLPWVRRSRSFGLVGVSHDSFRRVRDGMKWVDIRLTMGGGRTNKDGRRKAVMVAG
jgi:hypothetical protein